MNILEKRKERLKQKQLEEAKKELAIKRASEKARQKALEKMSVENPEEYARIIEKEQEQQQAEKELARKRAENLKKRNKRIETAQKGVNVLAKLSGILLETNIKGPTLKDWFKEKEDDTKSSSKSSDDSKSTTDKPKSSDQQLESNKKELLEISSILTDIRVSLNEYLKTTALTPQMLLEIQRSEKSQSEFFAGIIEGVKQEIEESGAADDPGLSQFLSGFTEAIEQQLRYSAFFPKIDSTLGNVNDSLQVLDKTIESLVDSKQESNIPDSKLAENENAREQAHVEERRHTELISVLQRTGSSTNGTSQTETDNLGILEKLGHLGSIFTALSGTTGLFARIGGLLRMISPLRLLALPVLGVVLKLSLIAGGLYLAFKGLQKLWDYLKDTFEIPPFSEWGKIISAKWDEFTAWVGGMFDLESWKTTLTTKWDEFTVWAGGMFDLESWKTTLTTKWDQFTAWANNIFNLESWKTSISTKWDEFSTWGEELLNLESWKTALSNKWNEFSSFIKDIFDFSEWEKAITDKWNELSNKAKEWFTGKTTEVDKNITIIEQTENKIREERGEFLENVRKLPGKDRNGIASGEIQNKAKGYSDKLKVLNEAEGEQNKFSKQVQELDKQIEKSNGLDKEELIRTRTLVLQSAEKHLADTIEKIKTIEKNVSDNLNITNLTSDIQTITNTSTGVQPTGVQPAPPPSVRNTLIEHAQSSIEPDLNTPVNVKTNTAGLHIERLGRGEEADHARIKSQEKRSEQPTGVQPTGVQPVPNPKTFTGITKLDAANDPNSLYSEFIKENKIQIADNAARDASGIISGPTMVSADKSIRQQSSNSVSNSSSTIINTIISPIFPKGISPAISMNA